MSGKRKERNDYDYERESRELAARRWSGRDGSVVDEVVGT